VKGAGNAAAAAADDAITPSPREKSSAKKRRRGANGAAITPLKDHIAESGKKEECLMADGSQKLESKKKLMYMDGMNADLVREHPLLEQFVCWTSSVSDNCGISRSGRKDAPLSECYLKVSVTKNIKFQAHKLMLAKKDRTLYTDMEGIDASHLCHNRVCWRPEHLTAEDHAANMARNRCGGWVIDVKAKRKAKLCTHVPPCCNLQVTQEDWTPI